MATHHITHGLSQPFPLPVIHPPTTQAFCSRTLRFGPYKGLGQGVPLRPLAYLMTLLAEALIQEEEEGGEGEEPQRPPSRQRQRRKDLRSAWLLGWEDVQEKGSGGEGGGVG